MWDEVQSKIHYQKKELLTRQILSGLHTQTAFPYTCDTAVGSSQDKWNLFDKISLKKK